MTWPHGYDPWGRLALFEAGRRAWFGDGEPVPDEATVRKNERRARLVDTQRRGRPLERVVATEPHELPRATAERVHFVDDGPMFVG